MRWALFLLLKVGTVVGLCCWVFLVPAGSVWQAIPVAYMAGYVAFHFWGAFEKRSSTPPWRWFG